MSKQSLSYGEAICAGFHYLMKNYDDVFCIGQGLWSPWYVGNSMTNLDVEYGRHRVIDTPVSETACTGMAIGASLCGYRPVMIHPRVDFMILAVDQIVNQAAKWSHMLGGQAHPAVTIRGIINRGGQQGAQHSQALHSWFAHVPGLRVVMPATVADARDLLIASVLSPDPVVFIDDRWLYEQQDELEPVREQELSSLGPQLLRSGSDLTLVGSSYSTKICLDAAELLARQGISADVIDVRVLSPFDASLIVASISRTRALMVVDGSWSPCGFAAEVITRASESLPVAVWRCPPSRVTLPAAPAPTSGPLEKAYYPTAATVAKQALAMLGGQLAGANVRSETHSSPGV